ncbi:MAG: hypothetical protein P4M15_09465, partial [Alphaproteobacteria bacterium]|nr:hypothetical protein [Alphaproteobacteria bacterium]
MPAASWFGNYAAKLFAIDVDGARALFDILSLLASEAPYEGSDNLSPRDEDDWTRAAWNSATGDLAAAIMNDPILTGLVPGGGLPQQWKARVESLLKLRGDNGRFVLVRLAQNLSWLFNCDETWSERTILSSLEKEDSDRKAFLAGFFMNPRVVGEKLFARLKPTLLGLAG